MTIINNLSSTPIIITDLDGTALEGGKGVSESLINASKDLSERGIPFTFATGRSKIPSLKYADLLNIQIPIICSGGAITCDSKTGNNIRHKMIELKLLNNLIDEAVSFNLDTAIYDQSNVIITKKFKWIENYCFRQKIPLITKSKLSSQTNGTVLLVVGNPKKIAQIEKFFKSKYSQYLEINVTFENVCEIASIEGSKLNAIKDLLKLLNLNSRDLIYIGDGPADIEALQYAQNGVVIKNSHAERVNPKLMTINTPENNGLVNLIKSICKY